MDDEVLIQLKFTAEVDGTIYRDALWFTEAAWASVSQPEIEAMKKERVDNWIATVASMSMNDTPIPPA